MDNQAFLSRNRQAIMGLAAIWIMLFHSTFSLNIRPLSFMIGIGYLGVDIFCFMSGFSMYHSYEKTKKDYRQFYKKRAIRVLIPFAPVFLLGFLIPRILEIHSLEYITLNDVINKTVLLDALTFRWFVPCICLCYLITPIIDKYLLGEDKKRLFIILGISIVLAVPFVIIQSSVALMILIRVPEYIIGYWFGKNHSKDNCKNIIVRVAIVIILLIIYAILLNLFDGYFLCDSGLYWWPAAFGIGSLVLLLSRIKVIDNCVIRWFGRYSFELYLFHVLILAYLESKFLRIDKNIINVFAIAITCCIGWGYAQLIQLMIKEFGKFVKKPTNK